MKVYVAIPLLREFENINTLLEHIFKQDFKNFHVVFCVNNPAEWYDFVPSSKGMASQVNLESFQIKEEENSYQNSYEKDLKDNLKTLDYLRSLNNPLITIIDKSTRNNAFPLKKSGVGYARKVIMDKIASIADDNDIIISLDGDTIFSPQYFSSVLYQFENNKDAHAIAVPYYHRLEGTEEQKKAALRYEIYMRHYLIEMLKINNPYAFTALGAAIAVKVGSYKKVGGITPYSSGEDFYLLQKIRKLGRFCYGVMNMFILRQDCRIEWGLVQVLQLIRVWVVIGILIQFIKPNTLKMSKKLLISFQLYLKKMLIRH